MSVATAIFRTALRARVRGGARAARPRHRDARRGHRRHARRAGVHARAAGVRRTSAPSRSATASRTCRRSSSTASTSRSSTCSRPSRSPSCSRYGGHLYFGGTLTLGTLFAFMLYVQNFFDPVQQLSQLYNTFLSATAALDKIMGVLDEEPEVVDRPGAATLAQIDGHVALRGRALHVRPRRRGAARDRPRRSRRARPSRSSATRAPASRRSRSCSPASTSRRTAASRSTAST